MTTFYFLQIKEIIKETSDAVSIIFNVPNALKNKFTFVAGQYITLKTTIDGVELRRAYSICSSPKSGELKVAVKAVENGTFSIYATTKLHAGDELEVGLPEGKFSLTPQDNKHYLGVAAGSGITPVLSMVKAVLETENASTFALIYGNKSATDTIFYNELNALKETYRNRFQIHYIFSRAQETDCLFGRIDKGNINYYIKNKYKEITFSEAFLCGPEEMVITVSETLQENNISKENIHFELFKAKASTSSSEEVFNGKTAITVLLDDEETTFTMDAKDDILAASLRTNLDAPYSCQGGVCSSCLAKVTEGNAVMVKNSILSESEVAEGFILTCQAHPTTAKITVDFDDV